MYLGSFPGALPLAGKFSPLGLGQFSGAENPPLKRWAIPGHPWRDFGRPRALRINPVGSLTKVASLIRKTDPVSSAHFQPRSVKSQSSTADLEANKTS